MSSTSSTGPVSPICTEIRKIPATINTFYNSLGKKIERITNTSNLIPASLKGVLQQIYWGLPYTLCFALCPFPINFIVAFGINIWPGEVKDLLGKPMTERLYLGTRNFSIVQAARYTMYSLVFPPLAMTAISYIVLAATSHRNAANHR